jgi:hypothetical protein
MLQRLYELKPIDIYGQLTNLITGEQHFVIDPASHLNKSALSNSMHLWTVVSKTAGMIADDVMAPPHEILIPSGIYEVNYYATPILLEYANPTEHWADPDQAIEANLNADGLYFTI